jgi:WD40 repeat protein/DNA polymerase III delta prime subunit
MDYLDFELEIAAGSRHKYPVAVIRSTAGEAHETMRFPFTEQALENQLLTLENALLRSGDKRRQILSSEGQTVQNFGRTLFDALFLGEVRNRYAVSQSEAIRQSKGLRVKLRIQPPELAALPWEFLYDVAIGEYVCLSRNTPIVRYLELPQPPRPVTVTPPLSLLGMATSPKDLVELDIEREKQRVEEAVEGLRARGLVTLTWLPGRTWQDLQRAMRAGPWHIFHFIGHGGFDHKTDEGLIALEDDKGISRFLSATDVGRLLTDHYPLRLVVLNSCDGARGSSRDIFSSTAATLIRRGIPAVLANQYEITDLAAIELSRAFYEALADGIPVDAAVSEARKAISLGVANSLEWGTPVLHMRAPDGVLFDLIQRPPLSEAQMPQTPSENAALDDRMVLDEHITDKKEITSASASLPSSLVVTQQASQQRAEVLPAQEQDAGFAQHAAPLAVQEPERPMPSALPGKSSNRQRLIAKVRTFWIAGVLEQSLHGAALIALGLHEQAEAVSNPWRLVLQERDTTPRILPAGTRITQAYDGAGGELLLLGEPGAGKTTLLLELARDLLDRAEIDETHPIPVVFNLSSWAVRRQPIAVWLVEELNTKYHVPRKLGQEWIATDSILPLLDGLDEVALPFRAACVMGINAYHQEHGLLPTVVCSRSADYLLLMERIQLHNAVVVQPLTKEQIESYLSSMGEQVAAVRLALQYDSDLQALLSTPLMLSIMTLAYHGKSVDDLLAAASPVALRQQVFATYVERMLERRGASTRYTPQQTNSWLTWLARQLVGHNQTGFYIERMQPDWLPEGRLRNLYPQLVTGLIYGLFALVGFGLYYGVAYGSSGGILGQLGIGLGAGLAGGLLFGLLNGLLSKLESVRRPTNATGWTLAGVGRTVLRAVLNGLLFTLFATGGAYILLGIPWFFNSLSDFLLSNLLPTALVSSAVFGVIDAFFGKQVRTNTIQPAEVFAWSWAKMGWNLLKSLFIGVLLAVLCMLLLALFSALQVWFIYQNELLGVLLSILHSISNTLVPALIAFVLVSELLGGLTGGLSSSTLDEQNLVKPNQGIRRSVRNGLLVGSVVGLVVMLIGDGILIVSFRMSTPQPSWQNLLVSLLVMLGLGLVVGLVIGLQSGGIASLQHLLLRLLLWRTRSIPWNYPRFLDYAVERILLRKVGGGYIFVHRLLLEYFAPPDAVVSSVEEPIQTAQTSAPSVTRAMPNFSPLPSVSGIPLFPLQRISRRTALFGLASLAGLIAAGGGALWIYLPHPLYSFRGYAYGVYPLTWSPDGKYIAASGPNDDNVQVWAASDGRYVYTYHQHSQGDFPSVNTIVWSPDSKRIASVGSDGAVLVWDAADGNRVLTYHKHEAQGPNTSQTPYTDVIDVVWSPNGKNIILTKGDGTVQIWDDASGKSLSTIHLLSPGEFMSIAVWSLDTKYIASLDLDGAVVVRDAEKGIRIATYQTQNNDFRTMVWSPDGMHIALIRNQDEIVQVWNVANGSRVYTYRKHGSYINDIAWSPDGKYIASGSDDQTVQVWDAVSGNMVRFYWIPSGSVSSVTWSPDGRYIASGNFDGTVSVWRVF